MLLLGVQEADGDDTEESVRELGELAATAGAQVAGSVIQRRERVFIREPILGKESLMKCVRFCGRRRLPA